MLCPRSTMPWERITSILILLSFGESHFHRLNCSFFLIILCFGILLTFTPMHFLGFNVMPRRIPDFPDYFNSWNYLSSIGSGITLICWLYIEFMETGFLSRRTHTIDVSLRRHYHICLKALSVFQTLQRDHCKEIKIISIFITTPWSCYYVQVDTRY